MTNYKNMLENDIKRCERLINIKKATFGDVNLFIGKYIMDYPDFKKGLYIIHDIHANQICNIQIIKEKLEYILYSYNKIPPTSESQNININNLNTNNNNTYVSITDLYRNIQNNSEISNNDKKELLNILSQIEDLQNSAESSSTKWEKAKNILKFVLDKGVDVAISFIPQILSAL